MPNVKPEPRTVKSQAYGSIAQEQKAASRNRTHEKHHAKQKTSSHEDREQE